MWFNINRNGQLGNRLFSRAHIYAAAKEYGETVVDWGLMDVAHIFPKVSQSTLPIYPLRNDGTCPPLPTSFLANERVLRTLNKLRPRMTGQFANMWCYHYGTGDPETVRIDSDAFRRFNEKHETVILNGFKLRCPDWVLKHREEISEYFQLPESLRAKWFVLRELWHSRYAHVIGIHIRLTDFKTAAGGRFYLSPADYARFIRDQIKFDLESTLFVIFSDETFRADGAYDEITSAFSGLHVYVNQGDVADDLCGMMACDRLIGPVNSTFSRWAAFAAAKDWVGLSRSILDDGETPQFINTPIPWSY